MKHLTLILTLTAAVSCAAEQPPAVPAGRFSLQDKEDWVGNILFCADGKTIVAGTGKNKIVFWDLATGQEVVQAEAPGEGFRQVLFSPDGKSMASVETTQVGNLKYQSNRIFLWEVTPKRQLRVLRSFRADAFSARAYEEKLFQFIQLGQVAFSADGRWLATTEPPGVIRIWEVGTPTPALSPQGGGGKKELAFHGGVAVAFAPDGKTMFSVSHDGLIHRWEAGTNKLIEAGTRTDLMHVKHVVFSPSGKLAALGDDFTTWIKETATGKTIRRLELPLTNVTPKAISPDDRFLIALTDEGKALFDIATGKEVAGWPRDTACAFSPDGKYFAWSMGGSIVLEEMPLRNGKPLPPPPAVEIPRTPLKVEVIANKDTHELDLGGLTAQEFSDEIRMEVPPPELGLTLKLRNTGKKPIRIDLGRRPEPWFVFRGPGAVNIVRSLPTFAGVDSSPIPIPITLAAGATHTCRIYLGEDNYSHLLLPGEYMLYGSWSGDISPAPKGTKANEEGFAAVTFPLPPIKIKVVPAKGPSADPLEKTAIVPALGSLFVPRDPEEAELRWKLTHPTRFESDPYSLEEALEHLGERYDVNFRIDEAAFKKIGNEGIGKEQIKYHQEQEWTSLSAVLLLILEPFGAAFEIRKKTVWIVPLAKPRSLAEGLLPSNDFHRRRLSRFVTLEPGIDKGTPLAKALEDLPCGIVLIDKQAFARAGIADIEKRPVRLAKQSDVRLGVLLRQLLNQADADFVAREGMIIVVPLKK